MVSEKRRKRDSANRLATMWLASSGQVGRPGKRKHSRYVLLLGFRSAKGAVSGQYSWLLAEAGCRRNEKVSRLDITALLIVGRRHWWTRATTTGYSEDAPDCNFITSDIRMY